MRSWDLADDRPANRKRCTVMLAACMRGRGARRFCLDGQRGQSQMGFGVDPSQCGADEFLAALALMFCFKYFVHAHAYKPRQQRVRVRFECVICLTRQGGPQFLALGPCQ